MQGLQGFMVKLMQVKGLKPIVITAHRRLRIKTSLYVPLEQDLKGRFIVLFMLKMFTNSSLGTLKMIFFFHKLNQLNWPFSNRNKM